MTMDHQSVQSVDPAELFQVVSDASAQDPLRVQRAAARLKELLQQFGTFASLQEIATDKSLPLPARQQAIIQLKNSVISHWKSRKFLSEELRVQIRSRCLYFIYEEDDLIAGVNEVIVSKLARNDYPNTWSNLVTDLMNAIDSNLQARYSSQFSDPQTTLALRRSLRIFNAFVKEYTTVRMLTGIRALGEVVQKLHSVFCGYYTRASAAFAALDQTTASSPRIAEDVLFSHLIFKIFAKMVIWIWNKTDRMGASEMASTLAWLEELFRNSAIQFKSIVELRINLILTLRASGAAVDQVTRLTVDLLTRHVRLFGKFFRRIQHLSPSRFVAIPISADLVLFYWSKVVQATDGSPELIVDTNEAVFPVRFLVQALVLFKDSLAQWTPIRKNGAPNEQTLSKEFVEGAALRLVTRFIPLNPADLDGWMADPEEWLSMEDKDNEYWEYHLRPCGERVLMTLTQQYPQYVVPFLESKLNEVSAQPTVDLNSVVQKEAVYCAIGRCATRMKEVIPFHQWLQNMLLPEARDTNPNFPIIKRRIAWLIGKWLSDMCVNADTPDLWEVLSHLLHDRGPGTDAVVRLTAATSLRECVDTVHFDADVFAPYLQRAVTDLVQILAESETLECKRRIVRSLNAVVERAEHRIVPLIATIAEPIPQLWNAAESTSTGSNTDWLLKASLLTVISTLTHSAKEQSIPLAVIVVPLVRESLSPGIQVHLGEDGLILWRTALRNTVTIESVNNAPGLIDLFPLAVDLLSENLDLLGKIVSIHESYFLLDAPRILQGYALGLFSAFRQALQNSAIVDTNVKDILVAIDMILQLAPSSLWGEALHASGLFAHFIKTLIDDKKSTILLTMHIYVFARIAIADARMFLQLMTLGAQSLGQSEGYAYEVLLDQWWSRFDNMSEPRHRKLTAMGIAALASTGRPEVLARLPTEIFNLWMDVFGEIKESREYDDGSQTSGLTRHWERDDPPSAFFSGTQGTPEYARRGAVYDVDPVRTTLLSAYVGVMLQTAESACGAQAFEGMYLSKADPLVLAQIQAELRGAA